MNGGEQGESARISPAIRITPESFRKWHQKRQHQEDLRRGRIDPVDTEEESEKTFNPYALGRCHRRSVYEHYKSPKEEKPPHGILAAGTYFEEELVLPYLSEEVAYPREVVRNSIWIEFTVDTHGSTVQYEGLTDPVLVDEAGYPILVTEVKTKETVEGLESPSEHHLPQVHAYQRGLGEKYDIKPPNAVLFYGSRKTFEIRVFEIPFDEQKWEEIVEWTAMQERYRSHRKLPDATPEFDWECSFCEYQHRCGRADSAYEDVGLEGLLPRYRGYPREAVVKYLRTHEGIKLTPTLAYRYLELADVHGVYNWECWNCSETYGFEAMDWDGDTENTPLCPACLGNDIPVSLSGPCPSDQLIVNNEEARKEP